MQEEIDSANAEFWNELCGTGLAQAIGVTSRGPEALECFDNAYFRIYPYLLPLVNAGRMAGKRVLEMGLGYGSLSQKLAEAGSDYYGLDIAPGPVRMCNHRLRQANLPGKAVVGSALENPFPDGFFDFVVSIGCLHHTGNVQRSLDEVYRVLAPGGVAVLMVYNKFAYRQWLNFPRVTLRALGKTDENSCISEAGRKLFDANSKGDAAPETVTLSTRELRHMLWQFEKNISFSLQTGRPLQTSLRHPRSWLASKLVTAISPWLGLDIYFEAHKGGQPSAAGQPRLACLAA